MTAKSVETELHEAEEDLPPTRDETPSNEDLITPVWLGTLDVDLTPMYLDSDSGSTSPSLSAFTFIDDSPFLCRNFAWGCVFPREVTLRLDTNCLFSKRRTGERESGRP